MLTSNTGGYNLLTSELSFNIMTMRAKQRRWEEVALEERNVDILAMFEVEWHENRYSRNPSFTLGMSRAPMSNDISRTKDI